MSHIESVIDDRDARVRAAPGVPRFLGSYVCSLLSTQASVVAPLPLSRILRVGRAGALRDVLDQLWLRILDGVTLMKRHRHRERVLIGACLRLVKILREPETTKRS